MDFDDLTSWGNVRVSQWVTESVRGRVTFRDDTLLERSMYVFQNLFLITNWQFQISWSRKGYTKLLFYFSWGMDALLGKSQKTSRAIIIYWHFKSELWIAMKILLPCWFTCIKDRLASLLLSSSLTPLYLFHTWLVAGKSCLQEAWRGWTRMMIIFFLKKRGNVLNYFL